VKTYSHLLHKKRKPSEYEIACSDLLYYLKRGFEVRTPLAQWYEKYQRDSPLKCKNWDAFCDPRETTYTKYTALQKDKEIFVDGIFALIDETGYDKKLSESWLSTLSMIFAPLRYPWHGLQMISSYVAQMAPSGRIVITSMFQAADEMRRVQRMAYRLRQLQMTHAGFGQVSQSIWEEAPLWQPLRELIENLLITYDWGEAFIALDLVVKPLLDALFMDHLGTFAREGKDELLGEVFYSINEDCIWHKQWSQTLLRMVLEDTPESSHIILEWSKKWYPLVMRAVAPFADLIDKAKSTHDSAPSTLSQLEALFQSDLKSLQIKTENLEVQKWT